MSRREGKRSETDSQTVNDVVEGKSMRDTPQKMSSRRKIILMRIFNSAIFLSFLAFRLVSFGDIIFAVFASVYVYIMSKVVFPPVSNTAGVFSPPPYFGAYVGFAGVIGLLLPAVLIVSSFFLGYQAAVLDAAPHVFLLYAQVFTENNTFWKPSFSLPIRALVPVMYNARRLVTLGTWITVVFSRELSTSVSWNVFERSLAVVNLVFWNFNLWCFLLPVYLPWAVRQHYALGSAGVNYAGN